MASPISLTSAVKLNNNLEMPVLSLGTFELERGKTTRDAVLRALEAGYRLFDTAAIYGNEQEIGAAIRASGIPRAEIFITTKLWYREQPKDAALRAFDQSLTRLGMDYVDLCLIH